MEEPIEGAVVDGAVPTAHPIDPRVREEVLRKLQAVETEHDVRVEQEWLPARPVP
jgi:hypothetical protein